MTPPHPSRDELRGCRHPDGWGRGTPPPPPPPGGTGTSHRGERGLRDTPPADRDTAPRGEGPRTGDKGARGARTEERDRLPPRRHRRCRVRDGPGQPVRPGAAKPAGSPLPPGGSPLRFPGPGVEGGAWGTGMQRILSRFPPQRVSEPVAPAATGTRAGTGKGGRGNPPGTRLRGAGFWQEGCF